MSITITITADYADEARAQMRELLGETVFNTVPTPETLDDPGEQFIQQHEQAFAPSPSPKAPPHRTEPEITPPARKPRAAKKADTVIQSDVTEAIVVSTEPAPDPYAGMTVEQKGEVLQPLIREFFEKRGEDNIRAVLEKFGAKKRTEVAASEKFGRFVEVIQAHMASTDDELADFIANGVV